MKKIITSALLLLSTVIYVKAQYVTIPDANFRAELKKLYPKCFNSTDQLDTTCAEVVSTKTLSVSGRKIQSLDGVEYFDGLKQLSCNNNLLVSLKKLPAVLEDLYIQDNKLTSLPALPVTIKNVHCYFNELSALPILPPSLVHLVCDDNRITMLPAIHSLALNISAADNCFINIPAKPDGHQGAWIVGPNRDDCKVDVSIHTTHKDTIHHIPDHAHGTLEIKAKPGTHVTIKDVEDHVVKEKVMQKPTEEIDISDLPKGLFHVEIGDEDEETLEVD